MLQVETLDRAHIKHAFFTRHGGVSQGIYGSLNCGYGSRDRKNLVAKNRAYAMHRIDLPSSALYTCHQVHSNNVIVVDENTANKEPARVDGLITTLPNVALGILTADCSPVLFADHIARVIGAAHAGWRGALNGILENTIKKMVQSGADISNITAAIGPTIGPDSYEVGPEFPNFFIEQSQANSKFFKPSFRKKHFLFNLPAYIYNKLINFGIQNISSLDQDTYSNEEVFFSYRRSCHKNEPDYGRQLSTIALS